MRVEIESNQGTCAHYFKMQATWKTQACEINQVADHWAKISYTLPCDLGCFLVPSGSYKHLKHFTTDFTITESFLAQ
jgi:hypothetical protein